MGIFSPYKPYPIGIFTGLQGSGKTTRARAIIRITDPSTAELVMAPKEDRDVLASTSSRWLTSFDNVKKISHSVSDALCCVCTGISYSAREYYTTLSSYETAEIARPMLMTAVQIRLNQDLRSRAICFDFSPLTSCKTESKYWREYEIDAPKILGALLDALSCALRNYAAANEYEGELPRMADHTVWVTAAEEALGWESGTYRNLLLQHQQEGMKDSDANSTLVRAALGFFKHEAAGWKSSRSYTVTEMYQGIMQWASNKENMPKDELKYLPRSPAAFSKKLRNYIPSLKLYGITIAFDDNDRGNKRAVTVSLSPEFIEECTTTLY